MDPIRKLFLFGIAVLCLAMGTARAETLGEYCKGHWTDPRKEYEDCVRLRTMEDAREVIDRAEDFCSAYVKERKLGNAAFRRCLDEYREPKVKR